MSEHASRAKGGDPLEPRKSVWRFAKSDDGVGSERDARAGTMPQCHTRRVRYPQRWEAPGPSGWAELPTRLRAAQSAYSDAQHDLDTILTRPTLFNAADPEIPRDDPDLEAGELTVLGQYLDFHRATLEMKCARLTEDELCLLYTSPSPRDRS